jgi:ABC-2 type transport system permease protein
MQAMVDKEIRSFLSDPQQLFFSLALPLLILAIFVSAFGNTQALSVTGYLVDRDGSSAAAAFVERLGETPGLTLRIMSEAEASRRLQRADITSYILLEPGFGAALGRGAVALKVYRRGNGGVDGQIFVSRAAALASDMASEAREEQAMLADLALLEVPVTGAEARAALAKYRQQQAQAPRVSLTSEVLGHRPEVVTFYLPGMVSMFAIFSVAMAAESMVAERKNGTLERLLTTKLSRGQMILGKWVAFAARTWVQILILFTIGWVWFGVFTPASFAQAMAFALAVVAAGAGLGMFIASVARTSDQAVWISVIVSNVMAMLGGSFTPVPSGSVIGEIARLTPNHYANQGFRDLIGKSLTLGSPEVLHKALALLAMAAGLLALSMALFRVRRDER